MCWSYDRIYPSKIWFGATIWTKTIWEIHLRYCQASRSMIYWDVKVHRTAPSNKNEERSERFEKCPTWKFKNGNLNHRHIRNRSQITFAMSTPGSFKMFRTDQFSHFPSGQEKAPTTKMLPLELPLGPLGDQMLLLVRLWGDPKN